MRTARTTPRRRRRPDSCLAQPALRQEGVEHAQHQDEGAEGDLRERQRPGIAGDVHAEGAELAADWDHLASPETYLGFARGQRFASERADHAGSYVVPLALRLNQWGLAGAWTIRQEGAHLDNGAGTIAYRFRARDVNLVMGSPRAETPFRVSIDGAEPGTSAGVDCDARGNGVVAGPRMYQLIRQPDTADDHTFEITFAAPGVDAYVFTFG